MRNVKRKKNHLETKIYQLKNLYTHSIPLNFEKP